MVTNLFVQFRSIGRNVPAGVGRRRATLPAAAYLVHLLSVQVMAVQYVVQDLGNVGALHLNNTGDYAGRSVGTEGIHAAAFVYHAQTFYDLSSSLGMKAVVADLNDPGQAVGNASGDPWLWEHGQISFLPMDAGSEGVATSINNHGTIAGTVDSQMATWSNGALTLLGTLGGTSAEALGINDSGQIVGVRSTETSVQSFFYSEGTWTEIEDAAVSGLNGLGQVIGVKGVNGKRTPFIWEAGVFTLIEGLPDNAYPYDINNSGQVVGSYANVGGQERAFLYSNGLLYDLTDSLPGETTWQLINRATSINDAGQIAGIGQQDDGDVKGYLMTPVPEPTALLLLLAGGGFMLRATRGDRRYACCESGY